MIPIGINGLFVVMTDEDGRFMIDQMTGFCFDPEIEVTKNGYKPFLIIISGESEFKTYQVKSESASIEFDKLIYPDAQNKNTYLTSIWIEKYSQNVKISKDSLIIYLDKKDREVEIKTIKEKIKSGG